MMITKKEFGVTKNGAQAHLYTLTNENGMEAVITDYGAILVSLLLPEADGSKTDVVLGYDRLEDYEENGCFFGAVIGRSANRIGGAAFTLDKETYSLAANENGNNLHTDFDHGFHKVMWQAEPDEAANALKLSYVSPDGENGFPGTLQMSVTYTLLPDNGIQITYDGVSDKKTLINVTNHTYFNLAGHDAGSIEDEKITITASGFAEILPGAIPTGKILPVEGTPMDFRTAKKLGAEINADYEPLRFGAGYDHNWVLKNEGRFDKVAEAVSDKSGIVMEVYTDLPGVQIYTANFLDNEPGKEGASYMRRGAVCFETQYYPDSVHHENFPQPVCRKGEKYDTRTAYRFLTRE